MNSQRTQPARRARLVASAAAGLVAIGAVIAVAQQPASAASTVSVNGGTTYQTIDGFGVSEAFGQADSIRNLGSTAQKQALDLLFNTTSGAGFSILRSLIPSDANSIEPNAPASPSATPNVSPPRAHTGTTFAARGPTCSVTAATASRMFTSFGRVPAFQSYGGLHSAFGDTRSTWFTTATTGGIRRCGWRSPPTTAPWT